MIKNVEFLLQHYIAISNATDLDPVLFLNFVCYAILLLDSLMKFLGEKLPIF